MNYCHLHVHSHYSVLDGMSPVSMLVAKAAQHGHRAMALTDHGNMSGAFQLYKACKQHGVLPYPGLEAYVVHDVSDKTAPRRHLTMMARNLDGYRAMLRLTTRSFDQQHYHYKPRIDYADLASLTPQEADGVIVLTGCHFGVLIQSMLTEHGLDMAAGAATLDMLGSWFPHLFVEVQAHGIGRDNGPSDDEVNQTLFKLAMDKGMPVVPTQDCHYCDKSMKPLHGFMKQLAYGAVDLGDVAFPGDAYHLSTTDWIKRRYPDHMQAEFDTAFGHIIGLHDLVLPPLEKYRYHVPVSTSDPAKELKQRCFAALMNRGLDQKPRYFDRVIEELGVITSSGFDDYILLVAEYCGWARSQGILINARGSANNSLVCWLMDITGVDPVAWGLDFSRFLMPGRKKPPDIDMDIEDERRADVVAYIQQQHELVQIGTYGKLGLYDDQSGGGLMVTYFASRRRALGNDRYRDEYGPQPGWHDIPADHQRLINELGNQTIYKSHGAHAAGFAISAPSLKISEWMPLMRVVSSDTWVTQMTMDDVEDAGFVKLDLLGLRSLTTMRRCLELIGQTGWDWIPLNDPATFKFLRQGVKDTGIFQFEGHTASMGCRQVKVKSVKDLVLVNALYRPAARNSGYVDEFLRNRDAKSVTWPHPIFEKHLSETWGVPAYQEQVLGILKDIGMPLAELNDFLSAIKVKHGQAGMSDASTATFERNYQKFVDLCLAAGMTQRAADRGWELVKGYAAYGFNKGHAVAYALLGYRLAYLKVNHPLEFHAALLETTEGTPKEAAYVREARRFGVRLLSADVNVSGPSWTIDVKRHAIRRGLVSIKGIGFNAASAIADAAPFTDLEDLIDRCPARAVTGGKDWAKKGTLSGVLAKLRDAGALRSLGIGAHDDDE